MRPSERLVFAAHAAYFLVTGLWPLVHYRSFEAVSGRKVDDWLVKTVSLLILPVGVISVLVTLRGRATRDARIAAAGASLALGASSVWYGGSGRVSRIYLADAAVEAALVAGLLVARRPEARRPEERRDTWPPSWT